MWGMGSPSPSYPLSWFSMLVPCLLCADFSPNNLIFRIQCLSKPRTKPELINKCRVELPRLAFYIHLLSVSLFCSLSRPPSLSLLFSVFALHFSPISLSTSHLEISPFTLPSLRSYFHSLCFHHASAINMFHC